MANKLLIVAVLVILGTMAIGTDAQQACASKLTPCYPFITNATAQPTDDCCNPLKDAVDNDLECLCNLYSDPTLLSTFNITLDSAMRISRACGITTDLSACNATSPTSSPSPPGVPGGDSGGADRIALTGITTLFLSLVSIALY